MNSMTSYETLLYTEAEGVLTIVMNRPEVYNALNETMKKELNDAFKAAVVDAWLAAAAAGETPNPCFNCNRRVRFGLLLDQDVDGRGEGVRVASLEEHDGAPVLLAAPDEFFFLLALGDVAPDRQRGSHHHGHHAHADEQGRHGIAPLVSSTALTG